MKIIISIERIWTSIKTQVFTVNTLIQFDRVIYLVLTTYKHTT